SLRGPFYISQRAEEVKNLQTMLFQDKTIYPEGIISGYYGYLTVKAVQRFQEKYNISRPGELGYGIAGPKTRAKLNELYALKSSQTALSEEVKAKIKLIQEQINVLMAQLIQMLQEEIKNKGGQN
ncbi:MAG: peptidoglycan-binding protein, partial [Candidatus Staskawiczbacteria bacterium]|nr:peptidoglycan-binding protein [Candidatus Staskawiczbacteria bacterium]